MTRGIIPPVCLPGLTDAQARAAHALCRQYGVTTLTELKRALLLRAIAAEMAARPGQTHA